MSMYVSVSCNLFQPRTFEESSYFLAAWQRVALKRTFGALMWVDYRETPIGPYRELLFIPGTVLVGSAQFFSISKIYVSTHDSRVSSIENWAFQRSWQRSHASHKTVAATPFRPA